jgi:SAM-dependent methyltransferase
MSASTFVDACPACGATDCHLPSAVAPGYRVDAAGGTFYQHDYEIRDCASCRLLFRSPRLSTQDLSKFYAGMDYRIWEVPGYHPTERAVHAELRRLPPGSRLLDFGCSSGRLLAPLVNDYECYGMEINQLAAAAARAKGLVILPDDALASEAAESFDAIVMIDVFEHLVAPLEVVSKLQRLLKRNGILLIVTGNGDSPVCRLDPAQFWYFRHAVHVCMLTFCHAEFIARTLSLRLVGWNLMTHNDEAIYVQLWQYLRHWAYWQFRQQTVLSRTVLPMMPFIRRARKWTLAPQFSVSRDHVLAVFRKVNVESPTIGKLRMQEPAY